MIYKSTLKIIFCGQVLLTLVLLSGCIIKTKLSKDEMKWLAPYQVGDTLIFMSDKGDLDTSIIVSKRIYYPEYIPIEVHDKYLPQTGVIGYKNRRFENSNNEENLVYILKQKPESQTRLFIEYLKSGIIILDLGNDSIMSYKKGDVYELNTFHPKALPNEPKLLYWSEKYGLVKYVNHDGTVWNRINL